MLAAAARALADARVTTISAETRFDAAYKAGMQAALAALMAHGFRPDTNRPGHHATVLQALSHTIGLAASRIVVLDTLRRKRNLSDYSGEEVDESSAEHCIEAVSQLLKDVQVWIRSNRPALLTKRS